MFKNVAYYFFILSSLVVIASCIHSTKQAIKPGDQHTDSIDAKRSSLKPGSSYTDTIIIEKKAAVFYYPDSLQLKKIEAITDRAVFESMNHEYFYQIRNSKIQLEKNWKDVRVIDVRNARYLLFRKADKEAFLIDLDTRNDPYGLFLFTPAKESQAVDMMNIDTELPRYFSN